MVAWARRPGIALARQRLGWLLVSIGLQLATDRPPATRAPGHRIRHARCSPVTPHRQPGPWRLDGEAGGPGSQAGTKLVAKERRWLPSAIARISAGVTARATVSGADPPAAWLMATAKNRAIDRLRHRQLVERNREAIVNDTLLFGPQSVEPDHAADDDIGDDLLRLIFIACHPVLSTEAHTALTLRLLGGLTIAEIARAFIVPEPTIAQRIVRAKRTLAEAHIPFEVPRAEELAARSLSSVLEVIYLIFNEGYAATAGEDWMRPALCEDALRLGRILAELVPQESEVHGLAALMEIQASRMGARVDSAGQPILLLAQNRGRWSQLLIRRGLAALERAEALGGALGPYALQAAIAACHARARTAEETDWARIVALYDALSSSYPRPSWS